MTSALTAQPCQTSARQDGALIHLSGFKLLRRWSLVTQPQKMNTGGPKGWTLRHAHAKLSLEMVADVLCDFLHLGSEEEAFWDLLGP